MSPLERAVPNGAPVPSPGTALTATDVRVGYGGGLVLDGVTLRVPAGRLAAVVGPNGAGKSTLVKAALGLVRSSGRFTLLGDTLRAVRRRVAYVPQRDAVTRDFPITAAQVVEMGRYPRRGWFRRLTEEDDLAVEAALRRTGVVDLADRPLDELSGGQRQRVFLARALAQQADLLVLDEPFAGVDARTEAALLDLLTELCRDEARSVVAVHHDLRTVRERFDHAVLLAGRVLADGPPAEVLRPELLEHAYGLAPLRGAVDEPDGRVGLTVSTASPPETGAADRTAASADGSPDR
ncbi:metal ABC transporter ATP-binding protein [Actinoalloteichus spitiensis]|uniref:metal ABC transporter ATP-binding protein n=1 Tax=Actinoalloteichus spitiensis TaxID=252394 RepID=UPI00035CE047|nr:metal ABC transporter ATP-binding protein [Actinoalloteichus spitiensis]